MRYRAMNQNYRTMEIGTGELQVRTPRATRRTLNNVFPGADALVDIMQAISNAEGKPAPLLKLTNAKSVNRWGTAMGPGRKPGRRTRKVTPMPERGTGAYCVEYSRGPGVETKYGRILLYRHSVWVMLHELAHIIAGCGLGHGATFGATLDRLTGRYFDYMVERGTE